MKNISIYIFLTLITLFACEKDETMVQVSADVKAATMTSNAADFNNIIATDKLNDQKTLTWNKADYGVSTEVTYTIQVDTKCDAFANPIVLGTTTTTSFDFLVDALNSKLVDGLGLPQHLPAELEVRVVSAIKGKFLTNSDVITFTVTPSGEKAKAFWLASDKWKADAAPYIYETADSLFEGYVYIATKNTTFKFVNSKGCGGSAFGKGSADGSLSKSESSVTIAVDSGYYKVNVDAKNLTYTLVKTAWGLIGNATSGGWNNSTSMTYNAELGIWKAETELVNGALKFRANNNWDLNYGPANSASFDGELLFNDPGSINIGEPGKYIVTVDFSRSKSPYKYTYKVIKSDDIVEPNKIWMPGGYQISGDPSKSDVLTLYAVTGSDNTVFEGYVTFPSGTWIKFTSDPDWGHTNYGFASAGKLTTDGAAAGIDIAAAGYYWIKVDTKNLAYSVKKIDSWGLIGTATPGGWDNSSDMTYDGTKKVWSKTMELVAGALKFRANNGWDINYGVGDSGSFSGQLVFDAQAAVNITAAGNYTVTLDFSRAETPYQFTYTVKKN